jgi:hypothetical protein
VARVAAFDGEARGRDVRVGGGDQAEVKGVGAELLLDAQAFGEGPAHEHVLGGDEVLVPAELARAEVVERQLLEATRLVGRAAGDTRVALGVALVLHHLDQRLPARAALCLLLGDR